MAKISVFKTVSDKPAEGVRERKKIRFRNDVMRAALRIYREEGFVACNVDRIAQFVESSRVTIYNYFPEGRDEILREAYRGITAFYIDTVSQLREQTEDPKARLLSMIEVFFDIAAEPDFGNFFCRDNPLITTVLIEAMGGGSNFTMTALKDDLKRCAEKSRKLSASTANNYATFLLGASRAAAMQIVDNPRRRKQIYQDYSALVEALIKSINH